jgi:hypothetical protein
MFPKEFLRTKKILIDVVVVVVVVVDDDGDYDDVVCLPTQEIPSNAVPY